MYFRRVSDMAANSDFSFSLTNKGSIFFCSSATSRTEDAVSSAKNGPSDGSVLFATAVTRRTLVWISKYQSLIRRSLASGCCIIECVASATVCRRQMPMPVISVVRNNTRPKPAVRRAPIFQFFIISFDVGGDRWSAHDTTDVDCLTAGHKISWLL